MTQPELQLYPRASKPDQLQADADALVWLLGDYHYEAITKGVSDRVTAHSAAQSLFGASGEKEKRRVRDAAEAAWGVLSAPGVKGYRLAEHTSVESYELTERKRYVSQIRAMERRLLRMDRAVHGNKEIEG